ncbi:hypothetical protein UlMin_037336 [Ulmus minor]
MNQMTKIVMGFIGREVVLQKIIIILYLRIMYIMVKKHHEKQMLKNHTFVRLETHLSVLDNVLKHSDIEYINELRMDRNTFGLLCELLHLNGKLKNDGSVTIEEQVCMLLHILAHHVKNRTIRNMFIRLGETISRYFNLVLNVVLRLQGILLEAPNPVSENFTNEIWKWFKVSLDGTYINVHVPEIDKPRYRTRKGDIATNVLGVCDREMKFIFVLPGWAGSASDSRVLRDVISRPNGLKVPIGFLAPYRRTRYHLSEWSDGCAPTNEQEYFNMKHASARNIIKRAFGLLKMRWAIKTQCRIIIACCLLYNLIRREMYVDPIESVE